MCCALMWWCSDAQFSQWQVMWQRLRHGRYVEFNLVLDEGTKYGLEMGNASTEAILMSLPRDVTYRYKYAPAPGTPEAVMQEAVKKARDWVPLSDAPAPAPAAAAPAPAPAPAPASK